MPAPNPAFYLEDLRARVQALGGVLLSDAYVNDTTRLRFRCGVGHEFDLSPGKLKQGRWCQRCGLSRGHAKHRAPTLARLLERVELSPISWTRECDISQYCESESEALRQALSHARNADA